MSESAKINQKNKVVDAKKSTTKEFLRTIDASKFFPEYAADVKQWKSKLRGYNGKKKPIDFSVQDYQIIIAGLKKMTSKIFISVLENEK